MRQGLIAETNILKSLNHKYLPSIVDVIDDKDTFLIVMDYIQGKSLNTVLKESFEHEGLPIFVEDVISWGKQLCDVLYYLHTRPQPIIYRDMKPANVMLKPDGEICVVDFGTARVLKPATQRILPAWEPRATRHRSSTGEMDRPVPRQIFITWEPLYII